MLSEFVREIFVWLRFNETREPVEQDTVTERGRQEGVLIRNHTEKKRGAVWPDDEARWRGEHPGLTDIGILGYDIVEFEKIAPYREGLDSVVDVLWTIGVIGSQGSGTFQHRGAQRGPGTRTMDACATPDESSEQDVIDRPVTLVCQAKGMPAAGEHFTCRKAFNHVEYLPV